MVALASLQFNCVASCMIAFSKRIKITGINICMCQFRNRWMGIWLYVLSTYSQDFLYHRNKCNNHDHFINLSDIFQHWIHTEYPFENRAFRCINWNFGRIYTIVCSHLSMWNSIAHSKTNNNETRITPLIQLESNWTSSLYPYQTVNKQHHHSHMHKLDHPIPDQKLLLHPTQAGPSNGKKKINQTLLLKWQLAALQQSITHSEQKGNFS